MATLYDFVFDATQTLDGVEGASGLELKCQICKQLDPNVPPILVPAGNASTIREAVRNHAHIGEVESRYDHLRVSSGGSAQVVVGARDVKQTSIQVGPHNVLRGTHHGTSIQAGDIHGDVRF